MRCRTTMDSRLGCAMDGSATAGKPSPRSSGREILAAKAIVLVLLLPVGCYSTTSGPCSDGRCGDAQGDRVEDRADAMESSDPGPDTVADRPEALLDGDDARPETTTDGTDESDEDAGPCPPEMVLVETAGACIDRHEASRGPGDVPVSVAGAPPWTDVDWFEADAACRRARKRLCSGAEWLAACQGPHGFRFSYGPEYRECWCNVIGADECYVECVVEPTGARATCEGGYPGLFDMSGNVAEWSAEHWIQADAGGDVATFRDPGCRWGGGFGSACVQTRTLPASQTSDGLGFRCCR